MKNQLYIRGSVKKILYYQVSISGHIKKFIAVKCDILEAL